jgi:hypothetical protein
VREHETLSLKNWYEHGFLSSSQLLHFIIMHTHYSRPFALIVYLLDQGARPDYQKNGVSTLARSFEALSRDPHHANFQVYFLLMALNDIWSKKEDFVSVMRYLKVKTQSASLTDEILLRLQRILLSYIHRKPNRNEVASLFEFQTMISWLKQNGSIVSTRSSKQWLAYVVQLFANPYYAQVMQKHQRITAQLSLKGVLENKLQRSGVPVSSLLSYRKELDTYYTAQAIKKNDLKFQLELLRNDRPVGF